MLSIFQRVRKSFSVDSGFGKYLAYAIGEILLLIAGILIALEINKWNEGRVDQEFQQTMLQQVLTSLHKDLDLQKGINEGRMKPSLNRIVGIFRELDKEVIDEAKVEELLSMGLYGYVFTYNSAAFEALKASGIERLKNVELRNSLIEYYGYSLPRTKELLNHNSLNNRQNLAFDIEEQIFLKTVAVKPADDTNEYQLDIDTSYKLENYQDSKLIDYLLARYDIIMGAKMRLSNLTEHTERIIKLVEEELATKG